MNTGSLEKINKIESFIVNGGINLKDEKAYCSIAIHLDFDGEIEPKHSKIYYLEKAVQKIESILGSKYNRGYSVHELIYTFESGLVFENKIEMNFMLLNFKMMIEELIGDDYNVECFLYNDSLIN